MSRLLVVAVLFGCVSAQTVCQDDADFLSDLPFVTTFGVFGTCGDWRDAHFMPARDMFVTCMERVDMSFSGIPGNFSMPAVSLQEFMAMPGSGREGAGCCGNSTAGSACDPFKGKAPEPPCAVGSTEQEGQCFPCYGRIMDGECMNCWGLDASGCTMEECTPELGHWDHSEGQCRTCTSFTVDGCDSSTCAAMGGNWDQWEQRCKSCRPEWGDVWGCSEQQCREADGMWQSWLDDGQMRGSCSLCQPENGWFDGCDEGACTAAMGNMPALNWKCWGGGLEDCRCTKCSIDGTDDGHWTNCAEHQCTPTAAAMDVKWKMVWGEGQCVRCFRDGDNRESSGCEDMAMCNAIDGFVWRPGCDPSMDSGCCNECFQGSYWGCPTQPSCMANGGHWCLNAYCTRLEDCHAIADPPAPPIEGPTGKIPEYDCNIYNGLTSPGSTGNYMMNSEDVTPWLSRWTVTISLTMPNDIDMMYGEGWLGLLGSDGGHPYPYFGYGKLMVERQNGPHPGVAHIDVREAGLMANEWYRIEVAFQPPGSWNLTVKEGGEETVRASVAWYYEYKDSDAFERAPIVAGSGYVDGEPFSGMVDCVTFSGDMALHYDNHGPAPAPPHPPMDETCGPISGTAVDAARRMGYEPRFC